MIQILVILWVVNIALAGWAVWLNIRSRQLDREISLERERVERLESELARLSNVAQR